MANVSPLVTGDPEQLGSYRLVGRIGQGGQGTVYLAEPPAGEPVAVKLLRAEWTRDPLARSRFAREVAAASRVAPFCTARIVETQLDGDMPYVVSEYIDGPSLHQVVAEHGPLAGSALDRLAVHTATALSAIHQAGVIHRDFKPGNVLMGPDGPRVIDFGIARWDGAAATVNSQVFGTPGYMAPEVVRGQTAGAPADVFAWAATITYAAIGKPPFDAPHMAAIVHQITSGQPDLGGLGGYLRDIVSGCLAKDPATRPTAFELLMSLLQHSAGGSPTPQVPMNWAGRTVPVAGEQALAMAVADRTAVLPPAPQPWPAPQQQQPYAWPQQSQGPQQAQPWSAPPGAARPGQGPAYPGRAGRPGYPGGPVPGRRPGGGIGAGRAFLVVVLVVLGLLAVLLVNALIRGPRLSGSSGANGSNSAARTGGSAASGRSRTSPAAPVAAADAIPSDFAGTWSGQATQLGGAVKQWSATLVLPGGATAGKMSITTIPCSATVTVTTADRSHIVLHETLVADPAHKCAAAGTITLRHFGADRVLMFWQQTGDPLNSATGLLDRG
jgi:hypothetical protein